jgi:hypothetical protein
MPALVITRHIAQLLASVSDRWVEVWNQFIRHPELDADITNRQNAPLLRSTSHYSSRFAEGGNICIRAAHSHAISPAGENQTIVRPQRHH